jgi:nitrate/TMAO reductase-like tetraheme cytochrome c subunit
MHMNKLKGWYLGLNKPLRLAVIFVMLVIATLTAITVSATTWEYTNSPEFCGTVCHTMPPEYAAYLTSPHAR